MVTTEGVREALHAVIDPELGLDVIDLGLVYDVRIEDGAAHVTFTLTSPACAFGPALADEIQEVVSGLDGIEKVFPRLTFDPPWTPQRMSEDARFALGM